MSAIWRNGERLGDRVGNPAADLVVALRSLRQLTVPPGIDAQFLRLLPGGVERRTLGKPSPLLGAHADRLVFALAECEHLGHGLAVGHQPGVVLPGGHEPRLDLVEEVVDGLMPVLPPGVDGVGDHALDALALKPSGGAGVLRVGQGVEEVAVEFLDAQLVETPHQRQEAGLVGRNVEVRDAEEERLVALVAAAVDEVGRLGVGARDDDAGHPHHVQLEPGGVEALDLFVRRHQNLAALMTALLGAGALVFDVVPGHADFDEAANQVAHVRVTAMPGVGVGDDERPEVDGGGGGALLFGHVQALVMLVAVGGEQRAHKHRGVVGHLAQRVAGEVGAGVLGGGALRRGRPTAEVDALDAHPLHADGLAG